MNPKVLFIAIAVMWFFSCQEQAVPSVDELIEAQDETALRARRAELESSRSLLDQDIRKLDEVIASLNASASLPLVSAFQVNPSVFEHYTEFQGTVKTLQNILVYPEMPGQLQEVLVKEGQEVKKNQIIARIDDGGLEAQLAQVEAQLALAQTVFERQQRLWKQDIGSEIQYLQAKTTFEAAQKSVQAMKDQLEKSVVKAPFDGTIDKIFKEPGTVVAPGMGSELFRVVDLDDVYLEVDVPETHVSTVVKGSKAIVTLPAIQKTLVARVDRVSQVINPSNRSFTVEIALDNKDQFIRPNLMGTAQLNDYTSAEALMIPQSVVSENANGEQYCFKIKSGENMDKASRSIIKTGKTSGDLIEVLDGIQAGDWLITEGAKKVSDGQSVKWLK